jgi:hypothetical protein
MAILALGVHMTAGEPVLAIRHVHGRPTAEIPG